MSDTLGFTHAKAQSILTANIRESTYVGLSSTVPDKDGNNFSELPTAKGYKRAAFGKINTDKDSQIANEEIIFFFVALSDCGSVTHIGFFATNDIANDKTPFFTAKLQTPLTVDENYVPLIREHRLILGLDIDTLDTSYG